MTPRRGFQSLLLICALFATLQSRRAVDEDRDGQHDFDFEIGTWKTHLSRLLHPLTGSTTWVELDGITTVRKVWDGRANLIELVADGPGGHFEGLNLRLYNAATHQWSLNFSHSGDGSLSQPTIGLQERARRVLRSGDPERPRDLRALRDLGHHSDVLSLRAGVFGRRREDLGSKLAGHRHASER